LLTSDQVAQLIGKHEWVFAKTMADNPHEYTLRDEWADDAAFDAFVTYIREHGYAAWFGGRKYIQLDVGDFFYWTMGAPLAETILVNRKRISGYTPEEVQELKDARRNRYANRIRRDRRRL